MNRNLLFQLGGLLIFLSAISCDDGEIIVTTFDFDENTQLQLCRQSIGDNPLGSNLPPINVIYTINQAPDETISIAIPNSDFTGKFTGLELEKSITISVNNTNQVVYRTFNKEVGNNYFCTPVPPSEPQVQEEYKSTNGGKVLLLTTITEQDDADNVPPEEESLTGDPTDFSYDTDGDGIPNFLDTDDDNDNVPTSVEISLQNVPLTNEGYPDTDNDGTADYLDEDDDNDGTITRYEDLNAFDDGSTEEEATLNPLDDQNAEGIPNYRNPNISESLQVDLYRDNVISRTFRTSVVGKNITLENSATGEEITVETLTFGSFKVSSNNEILPMDLG